MIVNSAPPFQDEYYHIKAALRLAVPELQGVNYDTYLTRDEMRDVTIVHVMWMAGPIDRRTQWEHRLAEVPRGANPLSEAAVTPNSINVFRVKLKMSLCL